MFIIPILKKVLKTEEFNNNENKNNKKDIIDINNLKDLKVYLISYIEDLSLVEKINKVHYNYEVNSKVQIKNFNFNVYY